MSPLVAPARPGGGLGPRAPAATGACAALLAAWALAACTAAAPGARAGATKVADTAATTGQAKKRDAPAPVAAVVADGVRYEAVLWGKRRGLPQNGGYIAALDERTGRELWLLKVYDVDYAAGVEPDKQDVFVTRLRLDRRHHRLLVENERGERFAVDLATHTVARL